MTINKLIEEHGRITVMGDDYILLEDAYIGGPVDVPYYSANAIIPSRGLDKDGLYPVFGLIWYPTEQWLSGDREDEGDACDWDNPDEIIDLCLGYDLDEGRII